MFHVEQMLATRFALFATIDPESESGIAAGTRLERNL